MLIDETNRNDTWNTNLMPSRVSIATGIHDWKYPLYMILCTSSWTSRTVSAELSRLAFSACNASISKSFLSSSSPSLFLTSTSLISTLSSSLRLGFSPFWEEEEDSSEARVRANEAEQRSADFGINNNLSFFLSSDWADSADRVKDSDAEQRRDDRPIDDADRRSRDGNAEWVDSARRFQKREKLNCLKSERVLTESTSWASEFRVFAIWEPNGKLKGEGFGGLRGIFRDDEVNRTSSFRGICYLVILRARVFQGATEEEEEGDKP